MKYNCIIGKFDGVHLGHQKLIEEIKALTGSDEATCAITFDPTPNQYFAKGKTLQQITTLDQKKELLYQYGIDEIIIIPFDQIADFGPNDFIKYILNNLDIKTLAYGTNFRFGSRAKGDHATLEQSDIRNFEVMMIDDVIVDGQKVSSSLIRELIQQGEISEANRFLGHHYCLEGCLNVQPAAGRYRMIVNGIEKETNFKPLQKEKSGNFEMIEELF